MTPRDLLGLCAGLALLGPTACTTVGPDYAIPDAAMVKQAAVGQAFQPATGTTPAAFTDDPWWQRYGDPQLDALVESALAANTDLRMAAANLARSEAIAAETDSANEVHGEASAAVDRTRISAESLLHETPIPVLNVADAGIRLAYQVDLVGELKRAAEAADADREAARAALDMARITIAADVALAYSDICASGHELAVAKHSLALQEESRDSVARLVEGGRMMTVDLSRAAALVAQTRASLPVFEARQRMALYRLAVLTGHPPGDYPRALASCTTPPRLANPIPVGDGAALLSRRPDVRRAERELASATARIGVATAAFYPSITLGLSAGATGLLGHMGQDTTRRWSLGPLISWRLPGGAEKARLRLANADADAALAHFDATVLKALQETENALVELARDLDRDAALRQSRDESAKAAHQIALLYRAGRLPYLNDLDAQTKLAAAEAELAANDSRIAVDQIRLFLALGGGWRQEPVQQTP
jgi:NodT family efflux transporter outer membrane factor (OMF) lipoprotein